MALGEVSAAVLGLVSAIASWMFFGNLSTAAKIPMFLAVLYMATKWSLRLVHLGFDGKVDGRA